MVIARCPDCGGPLFRRHADEIRALGLLDVAVDALACRVCLLTSMTSPDVLNQALSLVPDRHWRWRIERTIARGAPFPDDGDDWLPAGCSASSEWVLATRPRWPLRVAPTIVAAHESTVFVSEARESFSIGSVEWSGD